MNVNLNNFKVNDKIKFSVDWLQVRIDDLESPEQFINDFMEIFPNVECIHRASGGVNFYKRAYYCPEVGPGGIIFGYNVDENGDFISSKVGYGTLHGLSITVSGDGCRFLNSAIPNGFYCFVNLIARYNYNVSRIDMACDFLDDTNAIVPLIQLWAEQYYLDIDERQKCFGLQCGMHYENLVQKTLVYDPDYRQEAFNVTVGKRDSKKGVMQLYNKKVEIKKGRLSDIARDTYAQYGVTDYWWRLEYRCKSYSPTVFENLLKNGVYAAFLSSMDGFGRFYIPHYDKHNAALNITCVDWESFRQFIIGNLDKSIHLV